jgi:hypothetical protein
MYVWICHAGPAARFGRLRSAVSTEAIDMAEREGFEPPGLVSLPLSRRVQLSALPPFRPSGYRYGAPGAERIRSLGSRAMPVCMR